MKSLNKTNKFLIPSAVALGFIPLIVHAFYYNCRLSEFDWFPDGADQMSDFFLAWKMIAIILVGAVMAAVLLVRHFQRHEQLEFENAFYMLLLYGLFVAMAALFSNYKHWIVYGSHQMFESIWVLATYMVFCYYTYQYVREEAHVQVLLNWGGIGAGILLLIGAFQFLGLDFIKSLAGRLLISYPSHWGELEKIEFRVPKHTVYATLYNQNYLSFYCGMIIPVILALLIGCKKIWQRIVLAVAELLAVLCLIGSQSSSGWMALCMAALIVVFILLSRNKKTLAIACITSGVLLAGMVIACIVTPLGNKVAAFWGGTGKTYALRSIDTTGGYIEMDINGNILQVRYELDEETNIVSVFCVDGTGTELDQTYTQDDPTASVINNPDYLGCTITPVMYEDMLAVDITLEDHHWYFTKLEDGSYCIINQAGKLERYRSPEFSSLFNNNALNGRGHIWNGVIPILGKHVLIGSGTNTFLFAYPQNDYIYREYNGTENMLDVKAHSLYLQQWVENGLLALLAFLSFYIWYAIRSIRIYRKVDLHDSLSGTGIGIFTGTLSYMIVGLANDSNVCTAPVFWVMLGLGMAVNRIIVEKNDLFHKSIETEESADKITQIDKTHERTVKKKRSSKKKK